MPDLTETAPNEAHAFRAMFAARKRVFIDLLRWDLPVLADKYEVDQFDNRQADYLILLDENGDHRASTRLLPTDAPHLLRDIFPVLCPGPIPSGPSTREITRFCLDPRLTAAERRTARNELVTALVQFALKNGVTDYTGVANLAWFRQVRTFGWQCRALGDAVMHDGQMLIGLHISIDEHTLEGLSEAGCFAEPTIAMPIAAGGLA
ncbi:autoinducer synthase [Novosphingobium sp. SL115]|uniref:acyl-homoserine-lactone synthase n=1 Tax=Novosphingobium sp. SL115 TaxID=2995150 RepID=UPI0022739CB9|nr:acyl-homoserine-lactone synthase [Novosphingobium sp. SL115]MCY1669440.1 autoinducer synthase [Novosphingobium sp. SL115]